MTGNPTLVANTARPSIQPVQAESLSTSPRGLGCRRLSKCSGSYGREAILVCKEAYKNG